MSLSPFSWLRSGPGPARSWPLALGVGIALEIGVGLGALTVLPRPAGEWLTFAGRMLLGTAWIVAGWAKRRDPEATFRAVAGYRILPLPLAALGASTLPVVELLLGTLLLLGIFTAVVAAVTALLMVVFIAGIASLWWRGIAVDCGCFGSHGAPAADPVGGFVRSLLRDTGLLVLALILAVHPEDLLSLDLLLRDAPRGVAALPAAGILAVALLLAVGGNSRARAMTRRADLVAAPAVSPRNLFTADRDEVGFLVGRESARMTVVVHEDFLCPTCQLFEQVNGTVLHRLAAEGRVRLLYQPVALLAARTTTDYSVRAAVAAAAVLDAAPHRYLDFHRALLMAQPAAGGPGLPDEMLVEIASAGGVPSQPVASALRSGRFEPWVMAQTRRFREKHSYVPTILVDGNPLHSLEPDDVWRALKKVLDRHHFPDRLLGGMGVPDGPPPP